MHVLVSPQPTPLEGHARTQTPRPPTCLKFVVSVAGQLKLVCRGMYPSPLIRQPRGGILEQLHLLLGSWRRVLCKERRFPIGSCFQGRLRFVLIYSPALLSSHVQVFVVFGISYVRK